MKTLFLGQMVMHKQKKKNVMIVHEGELFASYMFLDTSH